MRRATWILWLMLALLPLRGWAVATMALPAAEAPTAHAAMAMADAGTSELPPCHQGAGDDGMAGGNCQSCDWCHVTLALPVHAGVAAMSLPAAPPRLAAARDTGRRLAGGLERPPRSVLA